MLTEISMDEWEKLVDHLPDKMVFHHSGWLLTLSETYHFPLHIIGYKENGRLLSALPMMQVRSLRGEKHTVSLPFTDFLSVPAVTPEARTNLLQEIGSAPGNHWEKLEIRDHITDNRSWHLVQSDWLHMIDLSGDMTVLEKRFSSNHRKSLAVAKKRGAEPRISTDEKSVHDFYALHVKTRKRKGLPVQPKRFFDKIYQHLIQGGHGGIVGVYTQNQMVAGGLYLTYGDVMTIKFNASDSDYLHLRPNHLVYYELMRLGMSQGYKQLDWGKTAVSNEGLRQFKLGWGAVEKPLFYSHLGTNTAEGTTEYDETAQVGGLLRYVSWVIKVSPAFVCRWAGELFYRYLS